MNDMETDIDEDTPFNSTQQTITYSTQYTLLSKEDSALCTTDEDETVTNPKSSPMKKQQRNLKNLKQNN